MRITLRLATSGLLPCLTAPRLRLEFLDLLGRLGLREILVEWFARLLAERLQVRHLRPGHGLITGNPLFHRLLGIRLRLVGVHGIERP